MEEREITIFLVPFAFILAARWVLAWFGISIYRG
jgi:hypothetical protein